MPGTSATLEAEWSLLRAACSDIPRQEKQARLRQLLSALAIYFALIDARLRPPVTSGQIDVLTVKTQRRINAALLDPDGF